jgi:hypothetical protein
MIAAIITGLLSACSPSEPTAPNGMAPAARARGDAELDCEMLDHDCAAIQAGINYLRMSPYSSCRRIGEDAQGLFDAPTGSGGGGFKYVSQDPEGNNMSVYMETAPFVTPSGYWAPDRYVGVMPSYLGSWAEGDPKATGGLLAHEVGGHISGEDGLGHNTQMAWWYQDLCLSEY